jgi:hypothetical protein
MQNLSNHGGTHINPENGAPKIFMSPEELSPYFSPYLQGGYRTDLMSLDSVEIDHDSIRGRLTVQEHYLPSSGEFHLTVPLAFVWIAQLGIIFACIDNGLAKKEKEIYLREITLTCKRPVMKTSDLSFRLQVVRKMRVANGVFYRGCVDIEDNSFVGAASFALPLE